MAGEERSAEALGGPRFPTTNGKYRSPAILTKPLQRCCAKAGIAKKLSAHCLRKTANDLLRRANGETVVRAMIGHATSEMTRLYSNVDHDEKARAHAAAFGDVLERCVSEIRTRDDVRGSARGSEAEPVGDRLPA